METLRLGMHYPHGITFVYGKTMTFVDNTLLYVYLFEKM